jgi:serine/threonine protein kinase
MPAKIVENWLQTGQNAIVGQKSLKPVEHALVKGKPLSSQKGQAEAFFLIDDNGNWWILKKFHSNCNLDCSYLNKVSSLLPREEGFLCGTARQILSIGALKRIHGCYYSNDLDHWLDGTILMPRVTGLDWACLADQIRDGSIHLDEPQRVILCEHLARIVELLENSRCAHRDLSCGNVFVDTYTWEIYLIDFDSLYHPTLRMPQATTCGTTGYTSHLAWHNGKLDPRGTWCEHADRYALALISAEFLLVNPGIEATGEGGIFEQGELKNQSGLRLNTVINQLRSKYPKAAQLLEAAIYCRSFSDCPSPTDWESFYGTTPGLRFAPPRLSDLQGNYLKRITDILTRCRSTAPLWPAPSLGEMPTKLLHIRRLGARKN